MRSGIREKLEFLPDTILRRGEEYYETGSILSLSKSPEGIFTGKVSGSNDETYTVVIHASPDGEVSDLSCTCPYDDGDVCKHIVAVLLAIDHDSSAGETIEMPRFKIPPPSPPDLLQLLQNLPHERLISIIAKQAEDDEKFKTNLILAIGQPDMKAELSIIKQKIRQAIQSNTRKGYIDYAGCDTVCAELSECLDLAGDRLSRGQYMIAFETVLQVLLTGVELTSSADDSSGNVSMVMDDGFEKLEAVCRQILTDANEKDKKYCYEKLCREALSNRLEDWRSWSHELLKIAAHLVTQSNKSKILDALDTLAQRRSGEERHQTFMDHEQTREDLTRLRITEVLEGKQAARNFIDQRLKVDEFRKLAIEEDIAHQKFDHAEKLCLEKISSLTERGYERPMDWWHMLYGIYQKTGNREKLLWAAKSLLLQGDFEYYIKLKALYQQGGEWGQVYPLLSSELRTSLSPSLYMRVLDLENEQDLLFEQVRQHTEMIFNYGKQLALRFPKAVYGLYTLEIKKAAREGNNRSYYKRLCSLIRELHQAGGKEEALSLIEGFMVQYKRRPAMVDELSNLKKRIK